MKAHNVRLLRSIVLERLHICQQCRNLSTLGSLKQQSLPPASRSSSLPNLPPVNRPAPDRQLAPHRIRQDFIPQPIGAPIGFHNPPSSIQDWFKLERAGDTYLERNAANGKILAKKYGKSYFRDFRNMDANRGKFYLANERLYRPGASLYFANLLGRTLTRKSEDTTSVLRGKVSIVTFFQRKWADEQVQTFIAAEENAELRQLVAESNSDAQIVEINHEEFRLSSFFVRLFEWNLRRTRSKAQQDRYFILRGIPQTVKDNLGMMNDKIGYVFLLDRNCRIRWSACADALPQERESLVKGVRKLLTEEKTA